MNKHFSSFSWLFVFIASMVILFLGIYALFSPIETYSLIIDFLAIAFVISGLFEVSYAFAEKEHRIYNFIMGAITLIIGIGLFMNPNISMSILPYLIGGTLLLRSILSGIVGFAIESKARWAVLLFAVLGILLSILIILHPILAILSMTIWLGATLIVNGLSGIALAFEIKRNKSLIE